MDLLAAVNPGKYGAGQVLTFALPIGTLAAVCVWGFFQRWPHWTQREEDRLFKMEDLHGEDRDADPPG